MSQKIKLIATDLDSTLTCEGAISPQVKDFILEIMGQGIKIGIASGRRLSDVRGIISRNGLKWGNPFPSFVISQERFILTPEGKDFKGAEIWNYKRRKETEKLISFILLRLPKWLINLSLQGLKPQHWVIESDNNLILQYEDLEKAEKTREFIKKWVGKISSILVRRRYIWVEVTLPLGKGTALNHLANILNFHSAEVLAIGDSANDLDMLNGRLGFSSAVVANAEPKVKEVVLKSGGYVASKTCGEGLVEIIKEFWG